MANTYTQIHIHVIFAVRNRVCLIHKSWQEDLHRYITGVIQGNRHKLLAINSMPDHVHILLGMRPDQSLSELVQDVKSMSAKWINLKRLANGKFEWQQGFGAFSHSNSQTDLVVRYIHNQEAHHAGITLVDEYKDFLNKSKIDYDDKYIFKSVFD